MAGQDSTSRPILRPAAAAPIPRRGAGAGAAGRGAGRPAPPGSSRRPHAGGRRPGLHGADLQRRARGRVQRFRRATLLAVVMAGFLLILLAGVDPEAAAEELAPPGAAEADAGPGAGGAPAPADPAEAVEQAATTIRELFVGAYAFLPKLAIALVILVGAYLLAKAVKAVLARVLRSWSRVEAISALSAIIIFLLALGAALSVIAGDARALVGSVGLTGLALSWALQAPIESFTGWLLNSFRGYYRVGDRIAVGEVFGDVYQIDVLTTTVWESGGEGKAVRGEQPTGALITFPNSEVLRANIVNYTRDFPYIWDEVTFQIAGESDLAYAARVAQETADRLLGEMMAGPAAEYRRMMDRSGLVYEVAREPSVFFSNAESWTNMTVRYLIPARQRRRWSTDLIMAISAELARPEHASRVRTAYPRADVTLLGDQGAKEPGGAPAS